MAMTTATTLTTITHDGVFVTASGRIKIAATPGTAHRSHPLWRMWIYNTATDIWQLQSPIFRDRKDAESAATLADRKLERIAS